MHWVLTTLPPDRRELPWHGSARDSRAIESRRNPRDHAAYVAIGMRENEGHHASTFADSRGHLKDISRDVFKDVLDIFGHLGTSWI